VKAVPVGAGSYDCVLAVIEVEKGLRAKAGKPFFLLLNSGADCRFRTGHLMITNQLLYQMS
jgi:hypothetical protein